MSNEQKPDGGSVGVHPVVGRTREGNDVWPPDAPIRQAMYHATLCRTCRHAADQCEDCYFTHHKEHGFMVIDLCDGYEGLTPNEPAQARRAKGATSPAAPCSAQRAGGDE